MSLSLEAAAATVLATMFIVYSIVPCVTRPDHQDREWHRRRRTSEPRRHHREERPYDLRNVGASEPPGECCFEGYTSMFMQAVLSAEWFPRHQDRRATGRAGALPPSHHHELLRTRHRLPFSSTTAMIRTTSLRTSPHGTFAGAMVTRTRPQSTCSKRTSS